MNSDARQSFLTRGSTLTASAATWCAVHCALTPLLAVAAPALALSETVELWMLGATVTLGAVLLVIGPATRRLRIGVLFSIGAGVWAASLAGWFEPIPEAATSAAGSLTVAAAMIVSARVCRTGDCEACSSEDSQ